MTTDHPLLYQMLRIRRVEERVATRYSEQQMRCPVHLCIGQEAIAVGVCAALAKSDWCFSNHRAHGHYLAKGGDLPRMIAEFYGSDLGCSKGRGGSMHLIDLSAGFLGSTPIVGGTVPLAVGAALTSKLQNLGKVVAVFFGDGCFEEGVVHEAMNFSVLHQLPILFICENNNFSVYTPLDQRQSKRKIFEIARAHGLAAAFGDGNDVRMIEQLVRQAVDNARNGMGPQFLELETYRWLEHCGPDFDNHLGYRTSSNVEAGHSACPIEAYLRDIEKSSRDSLMTKITHEIDLEIDAAFDFAFANLDVQRTDLAGGVYA